MSDSFWKKEISFGRKPKEPKVEVPALDTSFLEPDVESVPFWKKEVSLGRKKAPLAMPEPEPLTVAPVLEPEPELELEPEPVPAAEAEGELEASPGLPPGDYGWLTTDFDPNDVPDDM